MGGCERSDPQDPGNLQFDWLEVQLESFRQRKIQVRSRICVRLASHIINDARRFGCPDMSLRRLETTSPNVLVCLP